MLNRIARSLLGGFFMGTADLVPGVSGGTIALVLGFYERLVSSIRQGSSALGSLLKGDFHSFRSRLKSVEWLFLVPLLSGILLAVALLASFLDTQLEERPTIIAGLFLGLVLGSVVIAWRLFHEVRGAHLLVGGLVATVTFVLLGLGEGASVQDPSLPVYVGAGALAICAMILPGISGSLILLMFGMYAPVLGAVTDRDVLVLGVFVIGAIVGLAVFSQILYWALENHHDAVLAILIGLMAGSVRVLWPWPEGVNSPALASPDDDWGVVGIAFLAGIVLVFVISRLALEREIEPPV